MENLTASRAERGRSEGLPALDRGLYVGPLLAVAGLLSANPELTGGAAGFWVFSYAYCAPWLARAVRCRVPTQDHELVAAVLGWAAAPWGLFIFYGDLLTRPATIHFAVLGAMSPGVVAVIAANFAWKRRSSPARSAFLVSGAFVYFGWIGAYAWLASRTIAGLPPLGIGPSGALGASVFMLPASVIAIWLAIRLLVAPLDKAR